MGLRALPTALFFSATAGLTLMAATPTAPTGADGYWGQWRGPLNTGEAPRANPPLEWSEERNVRWKVEVPGRGLSTPLVWNDLVFVTTAVPAATSGESKAIAARGRASGCTPSRRSSGGGRPWRSAVVKPDGVEFVVQAHNRSDGKIAGGRC
jgi:hypothetical protein